MLDPPSKPFPNSLYQFLTRLEGLHHHRLVELSACSLDSWRRRPTLWVMHCSAFAQAHLISHDAAMAPAGMRLPVTHFHRNSTPWGTVRTHSLWHPHRCRVDAQPRGPAAAPAQTSPHPHSPLMRPQDLTQNRINNHMDRSFFLRKHNTENRAQTRQGYTLRKLCPVDPEAVA